VRKEELRRHGRLDRPAATRTWPRLSARAEMAPARDPFDRGARAAPRGVSADARPSSCPGDRAGSSWCCSPCFPAL
jgi:hypothetical protein